MNSSRHSELERLAIALGRGASMELYLTPKPGLVDLMDNGSHPDLSVPIMERSIGIVEDYLGELVASLIAGEPFLRQQAIAIRAEQRLYRELGTNTHKGYIFLSGMLLIAFYHADGSDEASVRVSLSSISEVFFHSAVDTDSNGARARRQFKAGGIIREATGGYPSLFDTALPVFRQTLAQSGCMTTASFAMMAQLMQTVDDTTTLHRGGPEGLMRVRRDGGELERIIADGGEFIPYLEELNREYKSRNLTIGGVADMLGIAFGWLTAGAEIAPVDAETPVQAVLAAG
ncbi:triphosphoribosyl-dephospho-CoA synthase [Propionivibrio soli]|uniref:triphosphoribosyl-dephospho-CoA synthase n=1 Tax=Propionivibrio soli TaxID=2976531 RepID=UPI0021E83DA5|nr:triphosphoribosyl-dephospho-CoA synthase [Propionivibrio soli]